MNSRTGIRVLCGALLLGGLFGLFLTTAHAQTVDTGLGVIGQTTGLTATDPRIIAARIINIVLGFLAIILTAVILYAGFLWMTAGGDSKQVDHAKDMIRNGIIGVIIILSSWAIVTFVISRLLDATGGEGGGISNNDGNNGGDFGGGIGGALGFQIRSIRPSGDIRLRNPEVVFLFSRDVRENTVAASIKVLRADNDAVVNGTFTTEGSLVTFVPADTCPAPHTDRHCFAENTEYVLTVDRSLRSSVGQSLACGGLAPACSARFRTGSIIDVLAPRLSIQAPFFGQNVPTNDNVAVSTYAEDDSGISFIESFANGRSIGLVAPSGTSTDTFFNGTIYWDTHGVATGVHQLVSRTKDLDSNRTTSTAVSVMVRPQHCFNLIQDEGETGLNCGGECGACSGDRAGSDLDCASGVRDAGGLCVDQPIITGVTPFDGRPGTFVSVRGVNFGDVAGTVEIGGQIARAPDACASAGSSLWTPSLVVVEVPEGATTGTVKLTHQNRRSDTTTDSQGPLLGEFRVNTRTYPGLCAVTPSSARIGETRRLDMSGVNLGVSSDRVYFNDRMFNSFLAWTDRGIGISSPLVESGGYAVSAQVQGVRSNPVYFRQQDRALSDRPVIDSVVPATGTIGGYITITGRNFGDRGQVFFRQGALRGPADVMFPAACSDNYWRNGSITVKVPPQILDGLQQPQALGVGTYGLVVSRDSVSESAPASFEVVNGVPGPGICGIQPMAGPSGTPVTIIGERFGAAASRITFAGAAGDLDAAIGNWSDQSIQTTVPTNAITGLVHVTAGGIRSNGVNFAARNCNEEASVCENGQACCRDGSCAVNGVCRAMATSAQMSWRTSTGRIVLNPTVVEECSAQNPPSPSPWSTRSGGGDVCVNAQVVVGFTTRIDTATLTPSTVVVTQCTGTGADPCASGTPIRVTGTFTIEEHDTGTYVAFTPSGTTFWQTNATFQVELK
ncbi:IPT/TIG domain-containing protein, partial [Patescibacteria group bacterium]|nr:IPT/TIG domain-containing protein [Patescibacteria group bacterium]